MSKDEAIVKWGTRLMTALVGTLAGVPTEALTLLLGSEAFGGLRDWLGDRQRQQWEAMIADQVATLKAEVSEEVIGTVQRLLLTEGFAERVRAGATDAHAVARLIDEQSGSMAAHVRESAAPVLASMITALPANQPDLEALLAGYREAHALASLVEYRRVRWHKGLHAETGLLRADFAAVGFQGREEEMADIAAWCDGGGQFRLRLYTGAGGMGKTRLWMHACAELAEQNWRAGFLKAEADGSDPATWDALLRPERLLLVIDYAETRRDAVTALLNRADAMVQRGSTLRLVLLARGTGDWWQELGDAGGGVGDLVRGPASHHTEIAPLTMEPDRRRVYFDEARQAFAELLEVEGPFADPPDLSQGHFERALYLHLAALAAVHRETIESASDLLEFVLGRESDLWRRQAPAGLSTQTMAQSAAMATLAGRVETKGNATVLIASAPLMRGQPADRVGQAAAVLHRLYPGPGWLNGLQPDVIGEHLVAREVAADLALLGAFLDGADAGQAHSALTVLTRLAQRDSGQTQWLDRALSGRVVRLAKIAMAAAVETGDPIGRVLAALLAKEGTADLAAKLIPLLPKQSVALRETKLEVTRLHLDGLRATPKPIPLKMRQDIAGYATNLANALSELGHREGAVEAAEESERAFRSLAQDHPEEMRPHHALSLNNLANRLSDLGRREEALEKAEEAVAIRRDLAAAGPDLAMSLNTLVRSLSDLGRREEALEKAEEASLIYRDLAAARPDTFRPELATSLNNLANSLSDLGRREEALEKAEELVAIQRDLAVARPDAFQPDLAGYLNTLANRLSDLGRGDEALEKAEEASLLYRGLAAARPDAFRPDVAMSLNNLANILSHLGRHEEALEKAEEAVAIRRDLAAARPDAFRPYLAISLGALHRVLQGLGRTDDALGAIREAAEIMSNLFLANPRAFARWMQMMATDYMELCEETGVEPDATLLGPIAEAFHALEREATGGATDES